MVLTVLAAVATLLDPSAWKCPKGVSARAEGGALVFSIDAKSPDRVFATADIPLPPADAEGRLVQEIEVENVAPLVWGGDISVAQIDASGKRLPETLADIRETGHARPVGKLVSYRNEGRLHPAARSLQARIELRRPPKGDAGDLLRLSRLAFSAAGPKPPLNKAFFDDGVAGGKALVLGGEHGIALAYQTLSRGAWSDMVQFRREEDRFYPAGAGTVEAFFRPDARRMGDEATLFEAYNGYICGRYHYKGFGNGLGSVLRLAYFPAARKMSLSMCDWKGKAFSREFDGIDLPEGAWTHVAVQWTPDGAAELFVGGVKRGEMTLAGYQALPLGDKTISDINDHHATEFFLGAAAADTRLKRTGRKPETMFQGAVDSLRVSTGLRYSGSFTPSSSFAVDAATRALFTFDSGYDGVSGGGFGWIPASVYANTGRVDYRAPAEIAAADDPRRIFDIVNYRDVPGEREFREARRRVKRSAAVRPGETFKVEVPERFYMDYVEISNEGGAKPLREVRVVNRGRADTASLGDLRESMALDGLSDREKADRIFQFAISASDYFMNNQVDFAAGGDVPHIVIMDGLAMLNGYCGFECGPLNNIVANLFTVVGDLPSTVAFGYGHMFEQVYFDGKNHIYDLSAQKFFPCFDNKTSAGLHEMGDEPGIFERMGSSPDHYIRKGTCDRDVRSPVYFDRMAVTLNPGERFRAWATNDGQVNNLQALARGKKGARIKNSVGDDERDYGKLVAADDSKLFIFRRDRIFPHYGNAFIAFDGKPEPANPAFKSGDGRFDYVVKSPYPVVFGEYAAFLKDGRMAEVEISTDRGRTFRKLPRGRDGVSRLEYLVKARHEYLVRVSSSIGDVSRFAAKTEVMFNPRVFAGWLHAGRNELTLKGKGETGNGERGVEVTVAWREPAKEIVIGENPACSGTIPGFERQIVAVDPMSPLRLPVSGAGEKAFARAFGKARATLAGGILEIAYDPLPPPLISKGDDNPEPREEFPQIAEVEIVDGDAVKTVTAIISPGARLLQLDRPACCRKAGEKVSFPCAGLKKSGRYAVFSLSRFPGEMERYGGAFKISDPAKPSDKPTIAKYHNGAFDYLKAGYSRKGERARWKWDTAVPAGKGFPREHSAWSFRMFEAPDKAFDLELSGDVPEGAEIAALLVIPEPGFESRLDLRNILFGVNCQPHLLRDDVQVTGTEKSVAAPPVADATPSRRIAIINPVKQGELRLTPTFACCSVSFGAPKTEGLVMEYRRAGDAPWTMFRLPAFFRETQEYRGSIWGLNEGTSYEVRFRIGERVLAKGDFTTWTTKVPIARTVELDPAAVKFPVVVSDKGTPDGWIRYTAKAGAVLHNPGTGDHFTVTNAAYVVFDGMELTGGENGHVFNLVDSHDIRCRNLNIHDWGQKGVPSYTEKDLGRIVRAPGRWAVNDHAFCVGRGMSNTVIERCWVHDQNSRSVSWYYSHPYGQNAVTLACPKGGTVLRWNDFTGSDDHRWNDAVTSYGNFDPDGGFNRDADVYGNYFSFAADDGIELDGGQQNIRVWENRFDMSFTGVSVQGNTVSPSYVWRNWFGPCRDEFGLRGATIKTSGVEKGSAGESVCFIWENTLGGGGWGEPIWIRPVFRLFARDNKTLHSERTYAWRNESDKACAVIEPDSARPGALREGEVAEMWPVRPLPFILDRQIVAVGKSREKVRVHARWIGGGSSPVGFKVVKNAASGWYDIEPKEGVISPGGLAFTVSFNGREPDRRFLSGVFLVRTKHGLSRPCLVTAETEYVHPLKCHRPREFALYAENPKAGAGGWYEVTFDLPKKGGYYFMVRGTSSAPVNDGRSRPELSVSVDGSKPEISVQQADVFPTWTMLCPARKFGHLIRCYNLDAGKHTLKFKVVKNAFDIEAVAVTDSPGSFERR